MKTLNFSADYLNAIVDEARLSPRRRQHRSIHTSMQDPSQRLFNAIGMDSYVQPHRHLLDPKAETLIAIRGRFALVIFNDDGEIDILTILATEKFEDKENAASDDVAVGAEIPVGMWHTIVALESDSILLEVKAGPYDPKAPREGAAWAPPENTPDGDYYLSRLRDEIMMRITTTT